MPYRGSAPTNKTKYNSEQEIYICQKMRENRFNLFDKNRTDTKISVINKIATNFNSNFGTNFSRKQIMSKINNIKGNWHELDKQRIKLLSSNMTEDRVNAEMRSLCHYYPLLIGVFSPKHYNRPKSDSNSSSNGSEDEDDVPQDLERSRKRPRSVSAGPSGTSGPGGSTAGPITSAAASSSSRTVTASGSHDTDIRRTKKGKLGKQRQKDQSDEEEEEDEEDDENAQANGSSIALALAREKTAQERERTLQEKEKTLQEMEKSKQEKQKTKQAKSSVALRKYSARQARDENHTAQLRYQYMSRRSSRNAYTEENDPNKL